MLKKHYQKTSGLKLRHTFFSIKLGKLCISSSSCKTSRHMYLYTEHHMPRMPKHAIQVVYKYKHFRKEKDVPFAPLQYYKTLILTVNKNYLKGDIKFKNKAKIRNFFFLNNRYWTLDFPISEQCLCQNTVSLLSFFLEGSGQQDVYKDDDNKKIKLLNII